jgi:hypothetical protein
MHSTCPLVQGYVAALTVFVKWLGGDIAETVGHAVKFFRLPTIGPDRRQEFFCFISY